MNRPLFSIIIPTRNRAHLLRYAVESALSQQFGDYEIVVSDNFSGDDTKRAAEQAGSHRVRYVRTEKTLAMPDSWEFALSHSRGEWVTVLCDDSVLGASLLKDTAAIIDRENPPAVSWPYALYYHPSWPDASKRNILKYLPFNGKRTKESAAKDLKKLYKGIALSTTSPSLYKAFCRRDVIEKIQSRTPKIFLPPAPDYSSAAAILFTLKSFVYLNRPYTIMGTAKESIGESHNQYRGDAFKKYLSEFSEEKLLAHVPTQLLNLRNFIAEALLRTAEAMGEKTSIDWSVYYRESYRDLIRLENNGVSVDGEKEELLGAMEKNGFQKLFKEVQGLTDGDDPAWVTVSGEENRFHDILSARAFLDGTAAAPAGAASGLMKVFAR